MLGQLCPPGLLVAISVLEALFSAQHGLTSVSLSYAQQTSAAQDEDAVRALRRLAAEFLPRPLDWHVVLYTYMGVYPSSPRRRPAPAGGVGPAGGELRRGPADRQDHRRVLPDPHRRGERPRPGDRRRGGQHRDRQQSDASTGTASTAGARAAPAGPGQRGLPQRPAGLVEAVLELGGNLGRGLRTAFSRGYLDIPFCLHPDNAGRSRSFIDDRGQLCWSHTGAMPIRPGPPGARRPVP